VEEFTLARTLPGATEIKPRKPSNYLRELASNKKAENIVVLDLRGISTFTDFFCDCSGTSEPQLKAIANELETRLREDHSVRPVAVDGFPASQWMVLDFLQVVVHIFHRENKRASTASKIYGVTRRECIGKRRRHIDCRSLICGYIGQT